MLVHTMQSGENLKVRVNGAEYSVIQISTYNTCHNSGRRVSLQYQGLFPVDRGARMCHLMTTAHFNSQMRLIFTNISKKMCIIKPECFAKTATQAQICTVMEILAQLLWAKSKYNVATATERRKNTLGN